MYPPVNGIKSIECLANYSAAFGYGTMASNALAVLHRAFEQQLGVSMFYRRRISNRAVKHLDLLLLVMIMTPTDNH